MSNHLPLSKVLQFFGLTVFASGVAPLLSPLMSASLLCERTYKDKFPSLVKKNDIMNVSIREKRKKRKIIGVIELEKIIFETISSLWSAIRDEDESDEDESDEDESDKKCQKMLLLIALGILLLPLALASLVIHFTARLLILPASILVSAIYTAGYLIHFKVTAPQGHAKKELLDQITTFIMLRTQYFKAASSEDKTEKGNAAALKSQMCNIIAGSPTVRCLINSHKPISWPGFLSTTIVHLTAFAIVAGTIHVIQNHNTILKSILIGVFGAVCVALIALNIYTNTKLNHTLQSNCNNYPHEAAREFIRKILLDKLRDDSEKFKALNPEDILQILRVNLMELSIGASLTSRTREDCSLTTNCFASTHLFHLLEMGLQLPATAISSTIKCLAVDRMTPLQHCDIYI